MKQTQKNKKERPLPITCALILISLTALVWLVFGGSILLGLHPSISSSTLAGLIMEVLALGCAVVLGVLVFLLARRNKTAYRVTVPLLALVAIISLADELGWMDFASFAISAAALVCLITCKRWYFK
jgi:hypothetical protein